MASWLPFEWIAASRFLREGRLQTIFIIFGVAIGVGVIVFMSAALAGQLANVTRRVLSAQAHIVLLPPKEVARPLRAAPGVAAAALVQKPFQRVRSIDQWQTVMADVARMPEVAAVSPMAAGSVLAVRGEASRAVKPSSSPGCNETTSISALSGWPKEDCTVSLPRPAACASSGAMSSAANASRNPVTHLLTGTTLSRSSGIEYHNIMALGLQAETFSRFPAPLA